jgi:hypothetical protein
MDLAGFTSTVCRSSEIVTSHMPNSVREEEEALGWDAGDMPGTVGRPCLDGPEHAERTTMRTAGRRSVILITSS